MVMVNRIEMLCDNWVGCWEGDMVGMMLSWLVDNLL